MSAFNYSKDDLDPVMDKVSVNGFKEHIQSMFNELNLPVKEFYYGAIDDNKPFDKTADFSDNGAWFLLLDCFEYGDLKILLGLSDIQAMFNMRFIVRPLVLFFGLAALSTLNCK